MSTEYKLCDGVTQDTHWKEKSLLLSLVLPAFFSTMDSSLIFPPQVGVSLFGWRSVCTGESKAKEKQSKANNASLFLIYFFYSFAQCDEATFKQEAIGHVCLTCSVSHHGLFVCPSASTHTPPHLPTLPIFLVS